MPKISKLLIANRGEIAVRIAKTCREMAICSVAIYSSADVDALHVKEADEALEIGPAPASESYLCIPRILQAARESGAQAVHPGYGFLAESAEFAAAVESAGLVWVGPPPDVISLMGDKVASKSLAQRLGIPVVPGYDGQDQGPERFRVEANRIGYPIMIKAAAGGGGRGMREVLVPDDLEAALESARREARSSFGDDRVFLEKLLLNPRHIEIQVLADQHGNAIHLRERDCSIQRRHQKVIEESPSPVLTSDLRTAMCEDAVRLVRASRYVGAGTVEFLFSADSYYFLEVNSRIQVEHPVTEQLTGLDLIRLQIAIATGQPLPLGQLELTYRGHTVEARLYAEDPEGGFLPSTGRLTSFQTPEGIGVRNDLGVSTGSEITPYYDSMLAKLIVSHETRQASFTRLNQSLETYDVAGASTNLSFLRWIASDEAVLRGRADVGFVDRTWPPTDLSDLPVEALLGAVGYELSYEPELSSSHGNQNDRPYSPWRTKSSWRQLGLPRSFTYVVAGSEHIIEALLLSDGAWSITLDGSPARGVRFKVRDHGQVEIETHSGNTSVRVQSVPEGLLSTWQGKTYRLLHSLAGSVDYSHGPTSITSGELSSPTPGTVIKVDVVEGQHVMPRDPLIVLEAMKMEHVISANREGIVQKIFFREGDLVPAGAVVLNLESV